MEELINQLVKTGMSEEQAENAIRAINEWLEDKYPVAGVLVTSWINSSTSVSNNKFVE